MNNPALNTLFHGDCIPLMQTISDNCIDLIVTDPPYLVGYRDRTGRSIAGDTNSNWMQPAFDQMYRILRPKRFAICFYGWNHADAFVTAFKKAGFRIVGHFVFAKHYASRKGYTEARHECAYLLAKGAPHVPAKALSDVMAWGAYTGNKLHPTQKPLEILRPLIKSYSDVGDVVLDSFAGSGSTLLAAQQLHRSWLGMELDATYHRNATNRLTSNINQ